MKRPLGKALLLFIAGVAFGAGKGKLFLAEGIMLLLIFSGFTIRSNSGIRRKILGLSMLLIFFITGILRAFFYREILERKVSILEKTGEITISGKVTAVSISGTNIRYSLSDVKSYGFKVGKAYAYTGINDCIKEESNDLSEKTNGAFFQGINDELSKEAADLTLEKYKEKIGSVVVVRGKAETLEPSSNEGGFDERESLLCKGISVKLYNSKLLDEKKSISIIKILTEFKGNLEAVYESCLPGEEAALLSGMTLGDNDDIPRDVEDLFRMTGICHLLTVSGTHIDIVSRRLYKRLKKKGMSLKNASIISIITAILFGCLCGNSVSTVRAVGMFVISSIGSMTGLPYDNMTALLIMAGIVLFHNPLLIGCSAFIFSFGTVLCIILFASPLNRMYVESRRKKWEMKSDRSRRFSLNAGERIVSFLIFSFGIQIAIIPITALFYYEIPVFGAILNLFYLPLFPLLFISGISGSAIYCLGSFFRFIPFFGVITGMAGRALLKICHYIIYYYEALADMTLKTPNSLLIVGRPGIVWLVAYYAVLAAILFNIRRTFKKCHIRVFILLFMIFILIIRPQKRDFEVNMLDVGQGDGIHISLGRIEKENLDLFVDGGSSSKKKIGRYCILPYLKSKGIRDIDIWFVTHPDEDHVSGLKEALKSGYRIKEIVSSGQVLDSDAFGEIRELAAANGTVLHRVKKGDSFLFGEGKDQIGIDFLSPDLYKNSEDINSLSLVFLLKKRDFKGIFTGDIDSKVEKEIISSSQDIDDITLLKACHHGSDGSNSDAFLDRLNPQEVIISAGKNNRYHHPGVETLSRIEERNIAYYCTKDVGQISINEKGEVSCHRETKKEFFD